MKSNPSRPSKVPPVSSGAASEGMTTTLSRYTVEEKYDESRDGGGVGRKHHANKTGRGTSKKA